MPTPNDIQSPEAEMLLGGRESEDIYSVPLLVFRPQCNVSNDKDSDFGDHEALMPAVMSKQDTTLDSDDDDDSIPKLCFVGNIKTILLKRIIVGQ
jgi:hypothetical protein